MSTTDETSGETRIVRLNASFDAFGMVMDLLCRTPPFAEFPAARLATTVRHQLGKGFHLAALTEGDQLVGYAGWTPTLKASAEAWLENRGSLKVLDSAKADAIALTTVVCRSRPVTNRLMRAAREAHPGVQVFFKRGYDGEVRAAKKQTVTVANR
jgi:hypothetical protein